MIQGFKKKLKGAYLQKIKDECIFCHLLDKESEKIIYESKDIAVFPPLNSGALKEAHLLIIPKDHFENLFDMEKTEASNYFGQMHEFLDKVNKRSRYDGVNLLSANGVSAQQSIKHLHFHLVLREKEEDYDLWPETGYNGEKFKEVNKELKNLLD